MTTREASQILQVNGLLKGLRPDRPVGIGQLRAPPFVDSTSIGMTFRYRAAGMSAVGPQNIPPRLAVEFASLADETDARITEVAKRWGALGVAEDGWPPEVLNQWAGAPWRESFSAWRLFTGRLHQLVSLGAEFNKLKPGPKRNYIAQAAGQLMHLMVQRFKVAPRFWWNPDRDHWQIDLDAFALSNLPALLIVQMMVFIGDKEGFAFCSNCKMAFPVARRPAPNRRSYCQKSECRRAALRDAQRDHRERERQRNDQQKEGSQK